MPSDKAIGATLLIISILIIIIYGLLVFTTSYAILLLKITGFIGVILIFGILAWIGFTLATTTPPKPIEEIEKELEEELKKIEGKHVEGYTCLGENKKPS